MTTDADYVLCFMLVLCLAGPLVIGIVLWLGM